MAAPRPKVQITFHPDEPIDAEQHAAPADAISTTIAPGARWILAALALLVLAFAAGAPAITGKFLPQDDTHVQENTALRTWEGLKPIWRSPQRMEGPYPITFTSYLLEYRAFHDRTPGYHVVNLLLHGLATMLLWTLLRKLEVPGAWLAAALFAVHPVQVATIAWIAQQKVLLCAVFYLSGLLAYLRYCGINPEPEEDPHSFVLRLPRSRALLYVLSMLLLLLALASQAIAVTFVPGVPVVIWWERAKITRQDLVPLIFPATISAIACGCFAWVEWRHGARGLGFPGLLERVQLIGHVFWFDLWTIMLPVRLSYVYPRWTLGAAAIWRYIPTLAMIAAFVLLWRLRRKLGRGPFAAAMLYAILVLPYSGLVNFKWMQQSYVGDHLLYLACAVPLIAIATAAAQRLRDAKMPAFVRPVTAAIVIVLFLSASIVRARDYQDLETLWNATLVRNPRLVPAHNALGLLAMEKDNNTAAAFGHFKTALDIDEENVDTHLNLARLYDATDQTDLAVGEYYQVLHRQPDHLDAHFGLARILARQGDSRGAIQKYRDVLAIQPGHKTTYLNLGQLHEERNEFADAIRCYREAISIDPRFVSARLNLALLLYRLGQINEALDEMRTIREIDPGNFNAWFNLGTMTGTFADRPELTDPAQKRQLYSQAAEYYRIATTLDPKSADAFCFRGIVLMKHSRLQPRQQALLLISEAIASFRRASELKSDYPQAVQYARDAELERERRRTAPDPPAEPAKPAKP